MCVSDAKTYIIENPTLASTIDPDHILMVDSAVRLQELRCIHQRMHVVFAISLSNLLPRLCSTAPTPARPAIVAAGHSVVEAALVLQVGAEDLQGAERLQILEMGVLLHVICDKNKKPIEKLLRSCTNSSQQIEHGAEKRAIEEENLTRLPDGGLHGVSLLQQHLDERRVHI